MRNLYKMAAIICIVFVLAVGVTGCVTSNSSPTTAPDNSAAAPVATTTPPAATGTDYSSAVSQNWVSKGYTITTPFVKTTVDGMVAYQGTVVDGNGTTYHITEVLTSSESAATSYAATRVSGFEAQGYTVVSSTDGMTTLSDGNGNAAGVAMYSIVYGTNSPGVGIIEE